MKKKKLNKKKILLVIIVIICLIGLSIYLLAPTNNTPKKDNLTKTIQQNPDYYHAELKQRYDNYQKINPDLSSTQVITRVNMNLDYPFYEQIIIQDKPLELNTIVNKYYKLEDAFAPSDLVYINDTYSKTNDPAYKYRKHQMRQVAYNDFIDLKKACAKKGFNLYVVSGYRSTKWQSEIYNNMVNTYSVERADQTCSRPGHSEHTTGLSCDIALDNYSFEEVVNHPQYTWFIEQLADYGFIIRYPEGKENLTGYEYESWHIRYLGKDLAKKVTNSNLTYDEYYAQNFTK